MFNIQNICLVKERKESHCRVAGGLTVCRVTCRGVWVTLQCPDCSRLEDWQCAVWPAGSASCRAAGRQAAARPAARRDRRDSSERWAGTGADNTQHTATRHAHTVICNTAPTCWWFAATVTSPSWTSTCWQSWRDPGTLTVSAVWTAACASTRSVSLGTATSTARRTSTGETWDTPSHRMSTREYTNKIPC